MAIEQNCQHDERQTLRDPKLKEKLLARLSRIEGQVRGIKGMVEKDAYCDDILNQMAAARAAIDATAKLVLENHVRNCVVEKIQNGEEGIIDELLVTIERLTKFL